MNDKKKSFLLYLDTLEILHKLTDEQAGKLLKAFLAYHSEQDLNLDPMLDLVFFSFQAQFERDLVKYKNIVERNKNNGSKGGRPKNPAKAKEPSGLSGNPSKPKEADSGSDKDSDSDSDSKDIVISKVRFAPPTDIETVSYFESKGSTAQEAEKFWLFYDSKNWMVGKSKMKKWKSSAGLWIGRNKTESKSVDILKLSAESNWEEGINDIF